MNEIQAQNREALGKKRSILGRGGDSASRRHSYISGRGLLEVWGSYYQLHFTRFFFQRKSLQPALGIAHGLPIPDRFFLRKPARAMTAQCLLKTPEKLLCVPALHSGRVSQGGSSSEVALVLDQSHGHTEPGQDLHLPHQDFFL